MKRLLPTLVLAVMAFVACCRQEPETPVMFAHRGCWSKNSAGEFVIPENSIAAVAMAARMGYTGIECDVRYTKDSVMVLMHDKTINRTVYRASDYSKIEESIRVEQLTYQELVQNYVLQSADPQLRTPVPTLEQLLTECKRVGVVPMLHSSIEESYRMAQSMFGDNWICFTSNFELLKNVRQYSACKILYSINKGTAEQVIPYLEQLGGKCGVSSMKDHLYTPEFCAALTGAGYDVQASIFKSPKEVVAQRNGITYQLTDFSIMPKHKPYDKLLLKNIEEYNHSWSETKECGAIVLDVEYQGDIEVVINNNRTYTLSRKTMGYDKIGNRFFNIAPQIKITAKQGATIKCACISVYEY